MKTTFWQSQLYTFLLYCNGQELPKEILDCGAGGKFPPLAIFADHGYRTYGIDVDDEQIELAKKYEKENEIELNISKCDMRDLPFEDESISFVYSYNTIFHMSKNEISKAIREIRRVLRPGGLCFVNFVSINDWIYGEGEKVGEGEYLQQEGDSQVLHSYHEINEAEAYFNDFNIIYKENRIREGYNRNNEKITIGFIDYIVEKKK